MKLPTNILCVLLCLLVATPIGEGTTERQLIAGTLASIFNYVSRFVVPTFNDVFQALLASEFDIFDLDYARSGSMKRRLGRWCRPKLDFNYDLGILTGLGSVAINKLKLDENTARLTGSPFGNMQFEGVFDLSTFMEDSVDLLIDASGKMKANVCGLKYRQNVNGNLKLEGAKFDIRLKFKGDFNALNLRGTLDTIQLQDIDIGWDDLRWNVNANNPITSVFNYERVSFGAHNALKGPLEDVIERTKDQILPYDIKL